METSRQAYAIATLWLSYLWWAWGRRTERAARTGRTCRRRAQRRGRTGRWGRSRALARDTDSVRGARTPSAAFSSCMARAVHGAVEKARQAGRRLCCGEATRGTYHAVQTDRSCAHTHNSSRVNRRRGRERTVTEEARDKYPPRNNPDADVSIDFF